MKNNDKIEQLAAEKDSTGKQLWQRVKQLASWTNSLAPTGFEINNVLVCVSVFVRVFHDIYGHLRG